MQPPPRAQKRVISFVPDRQLTQAERTNWPKEAVSRQALQSIDATLSRSMSMKKNQSIGGAVTIRRWVASHRCWSMRLLQVHWVAPDSAERNSLPRSACSMPALPDPGCSASNFLKCCSGSADTSGVGVYAWARAGGA